MHDTNCALVPPGFEDPPRKGVSTTTSGGGTRPSSRLHGLLPAAAASQRRRRVQKQPSCCVAHRCPYGCPSLAAPQSATALEAAAGHRGRAPSFANTNTAFFTATAPQEGPMRSSYASSCNLPPGAASAPLRTPARPSTPPAHRSSLLLTRSGAPPASRPAPRARGRSASRTRHGGSRASRPGTSRTGGGCTGGCPGW